MIRLLLCLAALVWAGAAKALDDVPLARSWQTEHGLPSNTIRWITQTTDGFMWLGTEGGLARFDGVRFVAFGPREGVPAMPISALLGSRDGALWVGCDGEGLVRLKDNHFTTYTEAHGLPSRKIQGLSESADGVVWIATAEGIARWTGQSFEAIANPPRVTGAQAILARRSGEIWVHFDNSTLQIWNGSAWANPPIPPPDKLHFATGLAEDQEGRLWAVARGGVALRLGQNGWEQFAFQNPPATVIPRPIAVGPGGEVCIGHLGAGLWRLKDQVFVPLSANDGSGEPLVEAVYFDRDGQLWVGSFSSGLVRLSHRRVDSIRLDPQRNADPVRALLEVQPGEIWIGTQGAGLWSWSNGTSSRLSLDAGINSEIYGNAFIQNHAGSTFIASSTVRQYEGITPKGRWFLPWPRFETIRSLAVGQDDTLFIGTASGRVLKLHNGAVDTFAPSSGCGTAWSLALTPDQALWIGTETKGVRRFHAGRESFFSVADGLRSARVNALHVDAEGTLWVGTLGGGLARWNAGRFQSVGTEAGLLDDTVNQIIDDSEGQIWVAGPRGLSAIAKSELQAVYSGTTAAVHPRNFGRADGMDSSECLEMRPIRDATGNLYFGTTKGFVRVNPRLPQIGHAPPRVHFENVLVDGERAFAAFDATSPDQLEFPPGTSRLEFSYTAPEFVASEQMRFRYRLAGLDDHWHSVAGQRSVNFNRLPPGRYRLEVAAAEPGGDWANPAAIDLLLRPYFWQTRWFLAVCGAAAFSLVAIAVWAIARRRAAREVARLEKQHAVDLERARIAKDLHDDLGASLTEIALFSDLAKTDLASPQQASEHLEHIFVTARKSARALDEIVWAANPQHDSLESFAAFLSKQAQDLARAGGMTCKLDLPDSLPSAILPSSARHHLFLAAREALHNVAKHSGAKSLGLRIVLEDTGFSLVIEDDGRGSAATTTNAGADGLENMKRRIEGLGGQFTMHSAPDRGTKVTLRVPLTVLEPVPIPHPRPDGVRAP